MTKSRQQVNSFIDEQNASHQVVVYSKSWCPHSAATKELFRNYSEAKSVDVVVHELDTHPNGRLIQQALLQKTGQLTVPNVFVNNQHLGGNDDVQEAAATGKLQDLLASQSTEKVAE